MSDKYQRGSVIVCQHCDRPIYVLERGLGELDRAGRAASAFRPLRRADLVDLLTDRPDVPPLWQANVAKWMVSAEAYRVFQAARPKSGDELSCPNCGRCWCPFEERDGRAAFERGYELRPLDIPPVPRLTSRVRPRWRDLTDLAVEAREQEHLQT